MYKDMIFYQMGILVYRFSSLLLFSGYFWLPKLFLVLVFEWNEFNCIVFCLYVTIHYLMLVMVNMTDTK